MKHIILLVLFLATFAGYAQVTNEFEPRSWSMIEKSLESTKPIILPAVDVDALQLEDQQNTADGIQKALRIGADIDVDYNLFNSGSWTTLTNGDRIWKVNIESKGALFMRAIFDLYNVPKGAELFVYNNTRSEKIGPYTENENQENGILGTWMVSGDSFWIEYFEPKAVRGLGRISLAKITHGYVDISSSSKVGNLNDSGPCNVDALCDPNTGSLGTQDWTSIRNDYINSVGRLLISTAAGTGFCSGAMISNSSQDGTPYFLTANHCLGSGADKPVDGVGSGFTKSVAFGFQWFTTTPSCASFTGTSGPTQPMRILSGGVVKANNDDSDMALFLINQIPPRAWNLYYAGWNRNGLNLPITQLGVHHPSGDIMKISRNDENSTQATFSFNGNSSTQVWRVDDWEYGVTEGGSSGSVLIDQNGLVIGQLAGGSAICDGITDNGGFDIYGRFDISWNSGFNSSQRLRDWLDPTNTGIVTQQGAYYQTLSSDDIIKPELDIKIFPNPSTGLFTIESDLPTTYQVYNLNGQLMINGSTGATGDQMDLSSVAGGLYFVKIKAGDQTITRKLVKQ